MITWFSGVRKSWDTMRLIGPKMEDTHAILSNDSCRQIQLTKAGGNPEYYMDAKKAHNDVRKISELTSNSSNNIYNF